MIRIRNLALGFVAAAALGACSAGPGQLPEPRPLVIQSGARLTVSDMTRMREIYDGVNRQLQVIAQDPSFLIDARPDARDVWPWETLRVSNDTASIFYKRTAPDLRGSYEIYAHMHLMRSMGRADDWVSETVDIDDDWQFEREVMRKVAESWLLGRALFDLAPYPLMDEVIYAYEAGMLDALLLNLRPFEFADAREAWLRDNPRADAEFRGWYRETFAKDPPGPPTN